jgi:hypothetical protein
MSYIGDDLGAKDFGLWDIIWRVFALVLMGYMFFCAIILAQDDGLSKLELMHSQATQWFKNL